MRKAERVFAGGHECTTVENTKLKIHDNWLVQNCYPENVCSSFNGLPRQQWVSGKASIFFIKLQSYANGFLHVRGIRGAQGYYRSVHNMSLQRR